MSLLVKICGVTTPEAVDAAVAAGAAAIGFVFHEPSPRHVTPERAAMLARRLPAGVASVAVTLHPRREDVERVLQALMPDVWQSDAENLDALELPACVARWPVFRHAAPKSVIRRRLIFDARVSGRGLRADWQRAAELARRSELVLAGGLDASNVGNAIAAVRPFGVDVSSGVESAPGVKDAALIRAFIASARDAAQAIGT